MIFDGLKTLIGDCDSYLKKGGTAFLGHRVHPQWSIEKRAKVHTVDKY